MKLSHTQTKLRIAEINSRIPAMFAYRLGHVISLYSNATTLTNEMKVNAYDH